MIGDAAARGKRSSTLKAGPEWKQKNSRGSSFKHVQPSTGKDDNDSGGHREQKSTAKRMHKQMKPFSPGVADRQAPHHQRNVKESEHNEPGDIIEDWCKGKRKGYR